MLLWELSSWCGAQSPSFLPCDPHVGVQLAACTVPAAVYLKETCGFRSFHVLCSGEAAARVILAFVLLSQFSWSLVAHGEYGLENEAWSLPEVPASIWTPPAAGPQVFCVGECEVSRAHRV